MEHVKIIARSPLRDVKDFKSGCGECRASCQSACKTSCTVANQACEQKRVRNGAHISRAE